MNLSFRVADDFNNKGNIHFNSIYLLANDFYNSANASISAKYLALDVLVLMKMEEILIIREILEQKTYI